MQVYTAPHVSSTDAQEVHGHRLAWAAGAFAAVMALSACSSASTEAQPAHPSTPQESSSPASQTPTSGGWHDLLYDQFDGSAGALPDPHKWQLVIGHQYVGGPPNFGTGEVELNTDKPKNVSLDGVGHVRITALRDQANGSNDPKAGWTSARIESVADNFKPPEGGVMRVDYRFELPKRTGEEALGYWPSIWAKPGSQRQDRYEWPKTGEFDFFENIQGLPRMWSTLHCGIESVPKGGPCNEPSGISDGGKVHCQPTSCQDGFHTGRFEWDRSGKDPELRWYLDDKLSHEIALTPKLIAHLPGIDRAWQNFTDHAGFDVTMNVAMGGAFPDAGNFGGGPTATTMPGGEMLVDYVRVSTKNEA